MRAQRPVYKLTPTEVGCSTTHPIHKHLNNHPSLSAPWGSAPPFPLSPAPWLAPIIEQHCLSLTVDAPRPCLLPCVLQENAQRAELETMQSALENASSCIDNGLPTGRSPSISPYLLISLSPYLLISLCVTALTAHVENALLCYRGVELQEDARCNTA